MTKLHRRQVFHFGLLAASALSTATVASEPVERSRAKADVEAIHAEARGSSARVIVELQLGPKAGPRAIRTAQRKVVVDIFGADLWKRRDFGVEPYGLSLMSITPALAVTVTPGQLDRLAAHPMVRHIVPEGRVRPN